MVGIADQLLDRALRAALTLERLKLSESRGLISHYERNVFPALMDEIEARLRTIGLDSVNVRSARTIQQLRRIQESIRDALQDGILSRYDEFARRMERVAFRSGQVQGDAFRRVLANNTPSLLEGFDPPNRQLLRSIVRRGVIPLGSQTRSLREWIQHMSQRQQTAIRGVLETGIARGHSIDRIVRQLRSRSGPRGLSKIDAERIARTSTTWVANQAKEETYKGLPGVERVQWISTLDTRTTKICLGLHERTWPVGTGERPPAHIMCRSTTIPLMVGVARPEILGADEFLNGLPPRELDQLLGRGIAARWRSGAIPTARDLIRDNLDPLTLRDFLAA